MGTDGERMVGGRDGERSRTSPNDLGRCMRNPDYLSLYLVLDPELCGGERGMVETASLAVAGGASCVQLRAPQWEKSRWLSCGRALKELLAPLGVPLIVNDHADVCLALDADGLHIGQQDLPAAEARALIGPHRLLGLSVSSEQEMRAVDASLVDYVGVGPVFATPTKADAAPAMGWVGLARALAVKPCPAVAIGGIKLPMLPQIAASGADGAAVVSAVCGQPDPRAAAAELRRCWDAARQQPGT